MAAVAFLTRARGVDGGRLGLLAICASSGYAIAAAAQSRLVKSVALVAPWLHDVPIAKEVYGSSYGPKAESGRAAGESFSSTGSIRHIPAASSSDAAAAMFGPADVLDYYLSPMRGAIPQWQNAFAEMSWEDWLNYDSHSAAQALDVPLQLVHSETAAIPHGARRFLELVDSPKSELWLEKRTQFDFYDDPKTVSEATEAVRAHFERTLATPRESTVSQQQP